MDVKEPPNSEEDQNEVAVLNCSSGAEPDNTDDDDDDPSNTQRPKNSMANKNLDCDSDPRVSPEINCVDGQSSNGSVTNSDQPAVIPTTVDHTSDVDLPQGEVETVNVNCEDSAFEDVDLDSVKHFSKVCDPKPEDAQEFTSANHTVSVQNKVVNEVVQNTECQVLTPRAQRKDFKNRSLTDLTVRSSTSSGSEKLHHLDKEHSPINCSLESLQSMQKNTQNSDSGSAKTNPSPMHPSHVLTIADDRLSLLSFESDCASSNEPTEAGNIGSSRCTTSEDDDEDDEEPWMTSLVSEGFVNSRRDTYKDLHSRNEALQQSLSHMSLKVSSLEKQLASQEAEFQEAMARVRAQAKAQVDKLRVQVESATKDKETMVVRYAQSEREVINCKKAKEAMDKKIKDLLQERENLLGKVKVLHADRVRACSSLDAKMAELAHTQREAERLKEELLNRDIKIKWAQNKLKEESDMHKETLYKLDQTVQRLRETREESEQVRRDCQDMIRRYQEAEEIKSVALDQQLKIKLSELEVQKQERSDQEEVYLAMRRELDAFKKRDKSGLEENNALTVKIQTLERDRLEHEQTVSKLKETLNKLRQEAVDLNGKLAETENLELQLDREREKVSASQREVERLRAAHQELQNDLEACHTKEGELLEFTQKLTTKTVHLQSEHSLLEVKAQNLEDQVSLLNHQCSELETANKELAQELAEEHRVRQEETQLLARKLAEKTKAVEALTLKLEEAENEARVLKRRHITSIKELSRELAHTKRYLEQLNPTAGLSNAAVMNNHHTPGSSSTPGDCLSLQGSSRTSSSASLVELNSSNQGITSAGISHQEQQHAANSNNPPPNVTFVNKRVTKLKSENSSSKHRTKTREAVPVSLLSVVATNQSGSSVPEINQQVLIDRIVRLQKTLARRNEKVDFLEEHVHQLLADIKKKSRLIQNYILREETGALAPGIMDQNKAEVLRRGGIMASVYGSHVTDSTMTLDLSLEINSKLQAVLEDTILKNITLKENINTLGHEIARISNEQKNMA